MDADFSELLRTPARLMRILLVEDDDGDAFLVTETLTRVVPGGYAITHVPTLSAALHQLVADTFDAVLLDLSLPDADGLDALTQARDAAPHVPFIVMTRLNNDEVALNALHLGAQDYLIKGQLGEALLPRALRYAMERQQIVRELTLMRDEAKAANRAKSQFLANMSHEIRTPMNAVLGYAEMLWEDIEKNRGPAEHLDHLGIIRRNGEHLLEIINDILDLADIDSGNLDVKSVPVSISELVNELVSSLSPQASAKRLRFRLDYRTAIPSEIHTDPTRLRQVLVNLLGNAIKFTEEGEVGLSVSLSEGRDGPEIEFEVTDTGIGMTAPQMERLFQPFIQADSSATRRYGGTGLRLAISKKLGELMGGRIEVESEHGRGSTFRMLLPTGPLHGASFIADPMTTTVVQSQTDS